MNSVISTYEAGTGGVTKGAAVKLSSGKVVAFTAAGDTLVGVALSGAQAGEEVAVCIAGECEVLAAGTISDLGLITTNATGRFVAQAASGSQTVDTYGKVLEGTVSGRYSRAILYDVPVTAVGT